jgi:hypothetical protein
MILLLGRNRFGTVLATCMGSLVIISEDVVPSACPVVQGERLLVATSFGRHVGETLYARQRVGMLAP